MPTYGTTAQVSLAEVATVVPSSVICLLSALAYHELGTQLPHQVWIAIGPKARSPMRYPCNCGSSGCLVKRSPPVSSFTGIEGVRVRSVRAAKTVADCFKFRNKIGLDVAVEALRDYRRKRGNMDDVWRYARICRVSRVMQPYLEAVA